MRPIILKTGTSFDQLKQRRGDYEIWFANRMGKALDSFEVVDALADGVDLPDPGSVDPVIVTGSPHSVHHKAPWSVKAGEWLKQVVDAGIPVLGICYGHQLLGDVFGGRVHKNPKGREMGVSIVHLEGDHPLFEGLPRALSVIQTHTDAVLEAPEGFRVLAHNDNTPVQAMAYSDHCVSMQWHPEFDADIIRAYINRRRKAIDEEGGPGTADAMLDTVYEVDSGGTILQRFVELYLKP